MNIYPGGDADPGGPLAPAEWSMAVHLEGTGEASYFVGDLERAGQHICRLVLLGGAYTKEEARRKLAVKARVWIADYLSRPHSGTTEFGSL